MAWLPSRLASAFVQTPVGGHAGEVDVSLRATFERGKTEPHSDAASYRPANWQVYQIGAGYTPGDVGFLRDLHLSLDLSYFSSPAEVNDPARGAVPEANCLGTSLDASRCQFYPADDGFFVTPRLAFNAIHRGDTAFGFFLQSTIPFGIDRHRFVLPRLDYIAGGISFGTHLETWLSFESSGYVGSGQFSADAENSVVATSTLIGLEARRWLLPWRVGIKSGPYFEGDLRRRFDERYDAAYTPGYPQKRERIQAMRFAIAFLPYVQITEHAALELGYVQKFFGYDAVATYSLYAGVRAAF